MYLQRLQVSREQVGRTSSIGRTYFPSLYPWYFRPFSSSSLRTLELNETVDDNSETS